MMVDFHACRWPRPELSAADISLANYFDAMNDEPLAPVLAALEQKEQRQQQRQRQQQQASETGAADSSGDDSSPGSIRSTAEGGRVAGNSAAADGGGGGGGGGGGRRPPIITFSHFLPWQVRLCLTVPFVLTGNLHVHCWRIGCCGTPMQVRPPAARYQNHFLERETFVDICQELLPEKRMLRHPNLAKAVGSEPLAARVAALQPDVHVFG